MRIAIFVGMMILLMAGLGLMYVGFRGLVAAPSSLVMELVTFLAGLVCLIAGLITGVYVLGSQHER